MGWLEGALRLAPAWRIDLFGYTISEVFWPGVVLPGITFGLLYMWPFIERRFTHDAAEHHILDRPRERPVRTVLFVAGSSDIGAQKFVVGIPTFTRVLQVLVLVMPIVTALITWKICRDLIGADELEAEKERIRHSRRRRVAEGGQPA
jgi:ubiquinol-cytochrome c reductase cytochrome b subunit